MQIDKKRMAGIVSTVTAITAVICELLHGTGVSP